MCSIIINSLKFRINCGSDFKKSLNYVLYFNGLKIWLIFLSFSLLNSEGLCFRRPLFSSLVSVGAISFLKFIYYPKIPPQCKLLRIRFPFSSLSLMKLHFHSFFSYLFFSFVSVTTFFSLFLSTPVTIQKSSPLFFSIFIKYHFPFLLLLL